MIIALHDKRPTIGRDVYIAPTAVVIGDVTIGDQANIWFGTVIRGDEGKISIGARTSVQDNTVIHVNNRSDTIIDSEVTIGHGVVLEGCHIETGALIGMNATVLSGSRVGKGSLVAAGSVVLEGQEIPPHSLAGGVPCKIIKQISDALKSRIAKAPKDYLEFSRLYKTMAKILPEG
jgi:carbonic anhydrase/acetyltransferase-like protein (isoleucine patch superfamily)